MIPKKCYMEQNKCLSDSDRSGEYATCGRTSHSSSMIITTVSVIQQTNLSTFLPRKKSYLPACHSNYQFTPQVYILYILLNSNLFTFFSNSTLLFFKLKTYLLPEFKNHLFKFYKPFLTYNGTFWIITLRFRDLMSSF